MGWAAAPRDGEEAKEGEGGPFEAGLGCVRVGLDGSWQAFVRSIENLEIPRKMRGQGNIVDVGETR